MGRLLPLSRFVRPSAWRLEPEPSTFAPSSSWSNKDMDPVPPDGRTWTTFSYVAYWISDIANVATWELASSMLTLGLSWFEVSSTLRWNTLMHNPQAASTPGNGSGERHHGDYYGTERHYWCQTSRSVPCPQSLLIWILVELFYRHLPSGFILVLVRDPDFCWLRMCLPGAAPPFPPIL